MERRKSSGLVPFLLHAFILPSNFPTMDTLCGSVSAPSKHLKQGYKQITVAGQNNRAMLCYINSYPPSIHPSLPLSLLVSHWPGVCRFGSLAESSELPTSHQCPVWKHARSIYVILWHRKSIIIIVTAVDACITVIFKKKKNTSSAQERPGSPRNSKLNVNHYDYMCSLVSGYEQWR